MKQRDWKRYNPPKELAAILTANPDVTVVSTSDELLELACGGENGKIGRAHV